MIKEKYHKIISIILIFVLILSIICVYIYITKNPNNEISKVSYEYETELFKKDEVLDINIKIDEDTWNEMIETASTDEYVPCDITVNGTTYSTVGIRPKGNASLVTVKSDDTSDKYSFRIDFGQYINGQTIYGLQTLALNNMVGDATYMKEYLTLEMFEELGVNSPLYCYANVTVNGEPFGLYLAVEVMLEEFLSRTYGENYGNLYKPETNEMDAEMNKGGNDGKMQMPNMNGNIENGNMPQMPNMDNSENGNMPQMPSNTQGSENNNPNNQQMPSMPDGNNETTQQGQENQETPSMPNNQNGEQMQPPNMNGMMQGGNNKDMNGGGMVKDTKGTNLVYIDDEIDSYSGIFDYVITKTTNDKDKKRLIQIIKQLNEGENLDECINVEEVLRYFAVNTFAVNLDSYASNMKHNYYLYENNGLLEILPWDLHLSFGGFNMGNSSSLINFSIDEPVSDSMENSPLISKLLEVPEYKEMYYSYLQELIDNYITSGKYEQSINTVDNLISEYVKNDANAFYTYDEYQTALENMKIFFTDRTTSVTNQMNGDTTTVETTLNAQALGTMGGGNGADKGKGNENMGNPMGNPNTNTMGNPFDNTNNPNMMGNPNENSQNNNDKNNNFDKNNHPFGNNQQNTDTQTPNNILAQNKYDTSSIIIILSSFASIIIATIIAKLIRRYK